MPILVAEVKTRSPFGFQSDKSWDELFKVANKVGHIISVHTNHLWGGSYELIHKARHLTDKPILAKGIHATDEEITQAFWYGADYVLVVGRIPGIHLEKCWIEPDSIVQLRQLPEDQKVVWNCRDLQNGGLKKETFADARAAFKGWLCQASRIRRREDVQPGADAILVGQYLCEFAESLGST